MSTAIDNQLLGASLGRPVGAGERARLTAAMKLELRAPRRSWRRDAQMMISTCWLLVAVLLSILLITGNSSPELLSARVMTVLPLLALSAVGAWFALKPGSLWPRIAVVFAGASVMLALVVTRGAGHPGSQAQWVCTLTHLSLGVGPLMVALAGLRRSASNMLRSVASGVAVGTAGAIAGEIGCDQSWQHVLAYHLTPWVVMIAAVVLFSRRIRHTSFAP